MVFDKGMSSDLVTVRPQESPRSLYETFFGRFTRFAAIPVLALSFVLPADGLGVTICWIKRWCSLPCPGCGLTRSITCLSQLEFEKAWHYHPFGVLIYGIFVSNVVLQFQNKTVRRCVQNWFERHDNLIRPTYWAFVWLFLVFGSVRFLTA